MEPMGGSVGRQSFFVTCLRVARVFVYKSGFVCGAGKVSDLLWDVATAALWTDFDEMPLIIPS